jgi:transcriptional regulator with XRE-family HTH domain
MLRNRSLGDVTSELRQLAGWTQAQLAEALNAEGRERTASKPERKFIRQWVVSLENGDLRREVPLEVRKWLWECLREKLGDTITPWDDFQVLPLTVATNEAVRLHEMLRQVASYRRDREAGLVLQIHSSRGFLVAGGEAELSRVLWAYTQDGIDVIFFIDAGWKQDAPEKVIMKLRASLERSRPTAVASNRFWVVQLPSSPVMVLSSLFCKVGVASDLGDESFDEALVFTQLQRAGVEHYWVHFSPDATKPLGGKRDSREDSGDDMAASGIRDYLWDFFEPLIGRESELLSRLFP